jgi:hypothetical protein
MSSDMQQERRHEGHERRELRNDRTDRDPSMTERRSNERRLETGDRGPRTATEPIAAESGQPRAMRTSPDAAAVRTNPDGSVVRTQPDKVEKAEAEHAGMWPDMTEFGARFRDIQSEFIDDPKAAVKKAEALMGEAVERITKSMQDHMRSMHHDVDGKDGDTESLRLVMRRYRTWIESMGRNRSA